ncbi:GNAT family N-acetyltransferase [Flavobacterium sp. H122]|uniref:GNAT family N-acetyltransferase n=1 Tax=Flavobacterium sp. H122 TaxID=2529860 RepID=UPI0010AA58C5|nr:N-acetyltransferase [Flavobacterium sp. H122]
MEIKDNTFSRQFETTINDKLIAIEYSQQERKLFLTKINTPEGFEEELLAGFFIAILNLAEEKKLKIVPTHPKIAAFFRKNPSYKHLLPPGIRI